MTKDLNDSSIGSIKCTFDREDILGVKKIIGHQINMTTGITQTKYWFTIYFSWEVNKFISTSFW